MHWIDFNFVGPFSGISWIDDALIKNVAIINYKITFFKLNKNTQLLIFFIDYYYFTKTIFCLNNLFHKIDISSMKKKLSY